MYLNEKLWKPLKSLKKDSEAEEKALANLKDNINILEKTLNGRTSLVGDSLTLCDIVIAEELINLELVDFDFDEYVNIQQWLFFIKQNLSCWEKVHQFFNQVYLPTIQSALK